MAKSKKSSSMSSMMGRGAEKRDVVINSYMPIDRMPKTLGHTGPVYYVPDNQNSIGYIQEAYDDWNG